MFISDRKLLFWKYYHYFRDDQEKIRHCGQTQTDMITRSAHLILAWEKEHSLTFYYNHLEADKTQVIVLSPLKTHGPLETRYAGQFHLSL